MDSAHSELDSSLDRHPSHSVLGSCTDSALPLIRDDWLLSPCIGPTSTSDYFENALLEKQERYLSKILSATASTLPPVIEGRMGLAGPVKNVKAHLDGRWTCQECPKESPCHLHVVNPHEVISNEDSVIVAKPSPKRPHNRNRKTPATSLESTPSDSCNHCGTTKTSLWRRLNGSIVCNACALYYRLHGKQRPSHLLHQDIRRRNRRDGKCK